MVCGKFVTGVVIATVRDKQGAPQGMTVNSFTSVSLDPPLVLFCVDHRVRLLEHFLDTGFFGINILSKDQQELSSRFARPGIERFAGVDWYEGESGVPLLPGVLAALQCKLVDTPSAGDHRILIGEVIHLGFREGTPLVFYSGAYGEVTSASRPATSTAATAS